METATLIIASLTLVTTGTFFYFYIKTIKEQWQTSQQRFNQTVTKLEEIKNHIENIVIKGNVELKEIYDTSTKLLRTGISELERLTEQLIKESSELKKSVNTDTKELANNYENQNKQVIEKFSANLNESIKNNQEFKQQLSEAHQQTLKNIKTELNKILIEIKSPLDPDNN